MPFILRWQNSEEPNHPRGSIKGIYAREQPGTMWVEDDDIEVQDFRASMEHEPPIVEVIREAIGVSSSEWDSAVDRVRQKRSRA